MEKEKKKAIVLLSGGLDSATCLAYAKDQGFTVYALSFSYGQRHLHELDCAKRLAEHYGVERHQVVDISSLGAMGGSALTSDIAVPKGRDEAGMQGGIPVTYVPARNTVFLSYALALAEVTGAGHIFIGVNAVDYSGYPDCRPEFIAAFERMANLATKAATQGGRSLRIHTPLIDLTKGEIIRMGLDLGVDYAQTSTCYDPDEEGRACGQCDACYLRLRGFEAAGSSDPAAYVPLDR